MTGLTIGWEYLTGYSVAAVKQDGPAEWPPHPGRIFLAMAAAWFETAPESIAEEEERLKHEAEGKALHWLETLGNPEILLPPSDPGNERTAVKQFVAVNGNRAADTFPSKKPAFLQAAPAISRIRQERTFHRRYVGLSPCFLHWPEADGVKKHRDALDRLSAKVTRIGHSSSLVRMWASDHFEPADATDIEHWEPAGATATVHCRTISAGTLNALPPPPLRPKLGLWSGYRQVDSVQTETTLEYSHFDTDLLVLTQVDGPRLPVVSTLSVSHALRCAVMQSSGIQPVPAWVSGHQPDGAPSDDEAGHLAIIPLPFVGNEHADGHLLGVGLAFPQPCKVGRRERGEVLGPLLVNKTGEPCDVELKLGRLGVWVLRKRDWSETRHMLKPETWTAHPKGAATWATVTPVVLDKFPKANRRDPRDRQEWEQEVRGIIANACTRIGLPKPIHIDIDTTSWHIGSPRAVSKRRPLRGQRRSARVDDAALGDGFPAYPSKGTNSPRPQVHAFLQFDEPVLGPIILGAGRYRGYGLFKPWEAR